MRSSSTNFRSLVDTVEIADQQHAQQELGINRRTPGFAVAVFQLLPHELEADVLVDEPQQVGFRNLIFQTEVVEQRFRAVVLPHHDQQASEDGNPVKHVEVLTCFRQISPANLSDFFNTHAWFQQPRDA